MEVINLNLIPNGTNPVVHVSQYDEGREFRFNLFDGNSVVTLDGTETIECDVKKPDGNIVTVAVTNTSSDYIVIATTLQMTACGGESLGTINITKGGVNIYSKNFVLFCERSPLENGIQSDSAIHNLETQVEDIVSEQYDSANVIFDNVPTSGHGIPYVVSSDGLLAYIPKNVSDMDDVTITTPVQGEALVFDADGNLVNGTVSTVGSIDDLNDVDTTGKVDGDSLRYDSGSGDWVAKPVTVALTQAEYDALVLSGDLAPNTHYVITDAPNLNPTASDIEYSSGVTVKQAIDGKANITALPNIKYQEINVALDGTGEGTLFSENKYVVGIKDIPSDSLYVGYAVYFAGTLTKVKSFSRASVALTSQGIANITRKIGVYTLENISTT